MIKYLTPILIISGLILPVCANAFLNGPIVPCGREGQKACKLCDFFKMGKNIIDFIYELILLLAPIFVLAGGIVILTSAGSPDKVGLGRKIITSAIIGLVIALSAWLILGTLFNVLIKGQIDFSKQGIDKSVGPLQNLSKNPWAWNEFKCE